MSFTEPSAGGAGALQVGSIFARVGALFDPRGWEQQQTAAREAKRVTERPIEARLTGIYDPRGAEAFDRSVRDARVQAARPIEAHARIHVNETDTRRVHEQFGAASREAKGLERDVEGVAGKVEGLGLGLGRFAEGMGGLVAGFGAFEVIKSGIERLGEMNRTSAITEARLRSTGDAAHVNARQIDELATSVFRKTGIDHEQIASSENMLLAYTHVRNELGAGHDVFNRAIKDAADLSVGTGRDLTGSIRALGIALDNPEKGMTRLSRAGIVFTDQQKAQIKAMEASGNMFGAQNFILREVERRYGGTANAAGTQLPAALSRAHVAWKDLSAMIAERAAPAISGISNWLSRLVGQVQDNTGAGRTLNRVVHEIGDGIDWLIGGIKRLVGEFSGTSREARTLRGVLTGVVTAIVAFKVFGEAAKWIDIAKGAAAGLFAVFEASPLGVIVAGAVAATVAVQAMGIKWTDLGGFITAVWSTIKTDVGVVVTLVQGWLHDNQRVLDSIGNSVDRIAGKIGHLAGSVVDFIRGSGALDHVVDVFKWLGTAILNSVDWLLKLVQNHDALVALGVAAAALVTALAPLAVALAVERVRAFGSAIGSVAGSLRNATVELGRFFASAVRGDLTGARRAWGNLFGGGAAAGPERALENVYQLTGIRGTGVGSEMNPMAVVVAGSLGAGAGGALPPGVTSVNEQTAASEAERGGIRGVGGVSQGGVLLPPGIGLGGSAGGAAAATEERSLMSRLRSGAGIVGGRLVGGLGIAGLGLGFSQMAGGMIGGQAGSAVGTIGGYAAVGAGAGSLFGPAGTIAGGLGGAIAGAFKSFFGGAHGPSKAEEYAIRFGNDLAIQITSHMPGAVSEGTRKGLALALAQGKAAEQAASTAAAQARQDAMRGVPVATRGGTVLAPGQTASRRLQADAAAEQIAAEKAYITAGQRAAQAFEQGFAGVRYKSAGGIVDAFKAQLGTLPKTARDQAAETTIEWAAELERNGQLPKGSLQKVLDGMKRELPGFSAYLKQTGMTSARDFADYMRLVDARHNLDGAIQKIQQNYGLLTKETKTTGDNIDQHFTDAMQALEKAAKDNTGKARTEALAELKALHDQADSYFSDLTTRTADHMKKIAGSIQSGSASASADAQIQFSSLFSHIAGAMSSSTISATKGMSLIAEAVNATLRAYKAPQIPVPILKAMKPAEAAQWMNYQFTGGTGATAQGPTHAGTFRQGGFLGYQGQQAPDQRWVLAADGEAFLTMHDQPHIDRALATARMVDPENNPYGSLTHLFGADARPAHFAQGGRARTGRAARYAGGGVVTASSFGGPGDRATGHVGYRGDDLNLHPDSFAELNMGTALGGLPHNAPVDVTYQGKTERVYKRDIGAGGPGLGGHMRAIDLWYRAAQAIGLPGLANVAINGPAGVNVRIGGAAGPANPITAPTVEDGGTMGTILRGGFQQVVAAANARLAQLQPTVGAFASVAGGPPARHGKFFFPLPPGSWTPGAVDQGWDIAAAGHTPEYAIGSGTIIGHGISGFGPWAPILQLDGGGSVYYGHAGPGNWTPTGTHVRGGQRISEVGAGIVGMSTGPHLEIGWYPPGPMGAGASMKSALGYQRGGHVRAPRTVRNAAPHISASHAKGIKIPDRTLGLLTGSNPRLASDLKNINKYTTQIDDYNAQFERLQRRQQEHDRIYGGQVPEDIAIRQTNALVDIKRKTIADLEREARVATRAQRFITEWMNNRRNLQRQATVDVTADERAISTEQHLIQTLHDRLTGNRHAGAVQRSGAAEVRRRQAAQKRVNAIRQRISHLKSEHGTVRKSRAPQQPRFDPYGNKLPPLPSGLTSTTVNNNSQIETARQQLADAQASLGNVTGGGVSQNTRQGWQLQQQLTEANRKLASDRARLAADKKKQGPLQKEITALQTLQEQLGTAGDPQTGLPGQVADAKLDIGDLQGALPVGQPGGQDWTVLPAGEQRTLDRIDYDIARAQALPEGAQQAAEIPIMQRLVEFWFGRLGELQREHAPLPVLTDATNQMTSALGQLRTLQTSPTQDQQAVIAQQAVQLQNLTALNASAEASLQSLTGTGDIGTGGFRNALTAAQSGQGAAYPSAGGAYTQAGAGGGGGIPGVPTVPGMPPVPAAVSPHGLGGGYIPGIGWRTDSIAGAPQVNLVVNALHPADPAVLANIADVTVNALGSQNFPRATRTAVL